MVRNTHHALRRRRHLLLVIAGPILQFAAVARAAELAPPVQAAELEDLKRVRVARVRLDDLGSMPADVRAQVMLHLDRCATDRDPDGSRWGVMFLPQDEVERLTGMGVRLDDQGLLVDQMRRFAPRRTMGVKRVPAYEAILGDEAPAPRGGPDVCGQPITSLQPYDVYHDYDEGKCFLENLETAYPNIARVVLLGQSGGGRDICALKISDFPASTEPDEQRIVLTGVTHAREWATHEVILYMAEYLTSRYGIDPRVQNIVNKSEVWLIPVVNPDGFEISWSAPAYRLWRKNARQNADPGNCGCFYVPECWDGVDINRNYDWQWGLDNTGSSPSVCDQTYRGPSPASEPETQVIQDFLEQRRPAIAVSFHSYGQMVLLPWSHTNYTTAESYTSHRAVGRKYAGLVNSVHGALYIPGQSSYTIYRSNGEFDDYAYGAWGALAMTPEVRPGSNADGGFELPENQILATCQENLAPALWLMDNVANVMTLQHPTSPTLLENPMSGATNYFSLPLTPINQDPRRGLGYPAPGVGIDPLQAWMDDFNHDPALWGRFQSEVEACGSGSGYRVDLDPMLPNFPLTMAWAQGLTSYQVMPYVFADGAEVMLSNRYENSVNRIGIPSATSVLMQNIRVLKRVRKSTNPPGLDWPYDELIQETRTALEDLAAQDPWIDWTWEFVDSSGAPHFSHPTGLNGASLYVEPFRAYNVTVHLQSWNFGSSFQSTYLLSFPGSTIDCNTNGIKDSDEGGPGTGPNDCNTNDIPDECEGANDCDSNGTPDACDLADPGAVDCNTNGTPDICEVDPAGPSPNDCNVNLIPDACDIANGTSLDCDSNGTPDECEPDCNLNSIPDACDIAQGTSADDNTNGVPDVCDNDCNTNGTPDPLEAGMTGGPPDCNTNAIPDECETPGNDCDANGTPDECDAAQPGVLDCNTNGTPDYCEVGAAGPSPFDCNTNGTPDVCDVAAMASNDCNGNGRPDECETGRCGTCLGDMNGDGLVDGDDIQPFVDCIVLILDPVECPLCPCADMNGDMMLDQQDLGLFVTLLLDSPDLQCPFP